MVTRTALATMAAAITLPLAVVSPAMASHGGGGGDVRTSGGCSGSAHWKLKAKPDDGRIEVEARFLRDANGEESIRREVFFSLPQAADAQERLAAVWEKTPVTKTLKRSLPITTMFRPPA